jgi:hypothetical protein
MEYNKCKLKDLLKIIRDNEKTQEVQKLLNINNLKYAKKKDVVDYLSKCTDIVIKEDGEAEPDVEEEEKENNVIVDNIIENIPIQPEPEEEVVHLNLDNIKNRPKTKKVPIVEDEGLKKYREHCRNKINHYLLRYPWLKYENINYDDPIEALKVVENKTSQRNFSELVNMGFYTICDAAETAAETVPMFKGYVKLQGFANNVRASQAVKDALDELTIKYMPAEGIEGLGTPEARLIIALGMCAYGTHAANCTNELKNKSTRNFAYDKSL